jgi:hypothetical protein
MSAGPPGADAAGDAIWKLDQAPPTECSLDDPRTQVFARGPQRLFFPLAGVIEMRDCRLFATESAGATTGAPPRFLTALL